MTIVNDDSRVVNKLETSLTDDARVVIYDRHMFIVQAALLKISNLPPPKIPAQVLLIHLIPFTNLAHTLFK
jgi:hypothetical protein